MDLKSKYRIRMENCIGTIIDVHRTISPDYDNESVQSQFEALKQAIEELDMNLVCEGDVLMVERATNALLGEFAEVFEQAELGPIYEKKMN